MQKIRKAIKNPKLLLLYFMQFKFFRILPDVIFIKLEYYLVTGEKLELSEPQTFNEKLQWLKLNDRDHSYTHLVDKLKVREHIKKTIGEEYLIPLYGVYNNFEEINFEELPNKFVLKPNHTSGNFFLCKDKTKINYRKLKKEVDSWMKREYYWVHREWPYKNVKPRLVIEKLLEDHVHNQLLDYKLMVFNGTVKCTFIASDRDNKYGPIKIDFYDRDWNFMPFERHYPNSGKFIEKPVNYDEMVILAEKLAEDFPFVRIDFYIVNSQIYFGEITFYPGSGLEEFTPKKYDYLLGSWIQLPRME